jgi:hypothetical protein
MLDVTQINDKKIQFTENGLVKRAHPVYSARQSGDEIFIYPMSSDKRMGAYQSKLEYLTVNGEAVTAEDALDRLSFIGNFKKGGGSSGTNPDASGGLVIDAGGNDYTFYLDGSYQGADSDGSIDKPFRDFEAFARFVTEKKVSIENVGYVYLNVKWTPQNGNYEIFGIENETPAYAKEFVTKYRVTVTNEDDYENPLCSLAMLFSNMDIRIGGAWTNIDIFGLQHSNVTGSPNGFFIRDYIAVFEAINSGVFLQDGTVGQFPVGRGNSNSVIAVRLADDFTVSPYDEFELSMGSRLYISGGTDSYSGNKTQLTINDDSSATYDHELTDIAVINNGAGFSKIGEHTWINKITL